MATSGSETYLNRKVYTLSQLGESIERMFASKYNKVYWFKAEISKLNYYPHSGHCYPLLVEKVNGRTKAEFRAMIYKDTYQKIREKFRAVAQAEPADGMNILFSARVGFHSLYGLNLTILDIEPGFTIGEMARERAQTIQKLKSEGLYTRNKQHKLPVVVQNIAVISVKTSKGYTDFAQTLKQDKIGAGIAITLFPALLQGDKAVQSINLALDQLISTKTKFDAVAIIRGGGGETGLNCYDNYELTSRLAKFPLPVCTGIGHATNETVAELVAWTNKITPTALAQFFIEHNCKFVERVDEAKNRLLSRVSQILREANTKLNTLDRFCVKFGQIKLREEQRKLILLQQKLHYSSKGFIKKHDTVLLQQSAAKMASVIQRNVLQQRIALQAQMRKADTNARKNLTSHQLALKHLETQVRLLDPRTILRRGYSITRSAGKTITSINELRENDIITTSLADGELTSRIIKTNSNETGKT